MTRQGSNNALMVRMLCVLALLFLGLGHKMPELRLATDPLELSLQLPDGTAPDLCVPLGNSKVRISYPDCDACRLSASVILPQPPQLQEPLLRAAMTSYDQRHAAAIVAAVKRSQSARGPPSGYPSFV